MTSSTTTSSDLSSWSPFVTPEITYTKFYRGIEPTTDSPPGIAIQEFKRMNPLLSERWFIRVFSKFMIDNRGTIWDCFFKEHDCIEVDVRNQSSALRDIPLSDGLIDFIVKLQNPKQEYDYETDSYMPLEYEDIAQFIEPYKYIARTEYLLHQQAKALEESRTTNKMLEARLSALEALLLPTPSPPKEIDLLGLNTTEPSPTPPLTHDLRTAVMDASDIPSLIVTDSHSS